jgi:hypothetical protein
LFFFGRIKGLILSLIAFGGTGLFVANEKRVKEIQRKIKTIEKEYDNEIDNVDNWSNDDLEHYGNSK